MNTVYLWMCDGGCERRKDVVQVELTRKTITVRQQGGTTQVFDSGEVNKVDIIKED